MTGFKKLALTGVMVVVTWLDSSHEAAPLPLLTTSYHPIPVPRYAASPQTSVLAEKSAEDLLGKPLHNIIALLGQPPASEGDTSCWWSIVTTAAGPRHLRVDSTDGMATRVALITEQGDEQTAWSH